MPAYARLTRHNVYPVVDAVYYGTEGRLEYDLILVPYADPRRIRIRADGASHVSLSPEADLVVWSPGGGRRQHKPVMYQPLAGGSRHRIEGSFRLKRVMKRP